MSSRFLNGSLAVIFAGSLASAAPQAQKQSLKIPSTKDANFELLQWYAQKKAEVSAWMKTRGKTGGIPDFVDFYIPKAGSSKLRRPTPAEARMAAEASALYDKDFHGPFGTFIESGETSVETKRGRYQWNSQRAAGLEVNSIYRDLIKTIATEADTHVIRIGVPVHQMLPMSPAVSRETLKRELPDNVQRFVREKVVPMWENGVSPIITFSFFQSMTRWEVLKNGVTDYDRSYFNNPDLITEMALMAGEFGKQLDRAAKDFEAANPGKKASFGINPVNEPETFAGFNRQFWHGAHANWDSPELMKYYIPSIIAIARMNVAMREAAELAAPKRDIVNIHNEAMTSDYYPSHKGALRFAVSKFMLGDKAVIDTPYEQLERENLSSLYDRLTLNARLGQITEVETSIKDFVFGSWNKTPLQQEEARRQILKQFKALRAAHLDYQKTMGRSMKERTVLLVDYYQQTEFILSRSIAQLAKEVSSDGGAKLREILGAADDAALLNILKNTAEESEKETGQKIWKNYTSLDQIDLPNLLALEDGIMFDKLVGIRGDYSLSDDPALLERQTKLKFRPAMEKIWRTDKLLTELTENDDAKLIEVLGVKTKAEAQKIVADAARDTRDGGPIVEIGANDTLRDILNKNGRIVLHRLLGLKKSYFLGFLPQQYARQIRNGIRRGLAAHIVEYINELGIYAFGMGESGTPFGELSPMLHDQEMLEIMSIVQDAADANLPLFMKQKGIGPAINTRGWAKGPLSNHLADDHEVNPSGITELVKENGMYKVRMRSFEGQSGPWYNVFAKPILETVARSKSSRPVLEIADARGKRAAAEPPPASKFKPAPHVIRSCDAAIGSK